MAKDKIAKENASIVKNCLKAPTTLEDAWGKGGDLGTKRLKLWDKWFRKFSATVVDCKNEGHLTKDAEEAALNACAAILALDVPHWDHPSDIAYIRSELRSHQDWADYPEVQGGFDMYYEDYVDEDDF